MAILAWVVSNSQLRPNGSARMALTAMIDMGAR